MIMTNKTMQMMGTTTTTATHQQQPEKSSSKDEKDMETTTTLITNNTTTINNNNKRHKKWGKQRHFPRVRRGAVKVTFARTQDNEVYTIPPRQIIITDDDDDDDDTDTTTDIKSQIWFSSMELKNIQKRAYEMSQRLLDDSSSASASATTTNSNIRPSLVAVTSPPENTETSTKPKEVSSVVTPIVTTTTTHTLDAEIIEKYGDSARGLELINQYHEKQQRVLSGSSSIYAKSLKKYSRTSSIASIVWSLNIQEEEDSSIKGCLYADDDDDDSTTSFINKPSSSTSSTSTSTKNYLPANRESIMLAHAYCLGSEKSMRRAMKIAQLDKQYVDEYVDVDYFRTTKTKTKTTTMYNNNNNGNGCSKLNENEEEETEESQNEDEEEFEFNNNKIIKNLNPSQIQDICCRLLIGIKIQDRTFHFKTYDKCFIAHEAVDFMIDNGIASNRTDAVIIGKYLQKELHLWYHVCYPQSKHDFQDGYLFFRFASSEQINETISNLSL